MKKILFITENIGTTAPGIVFERLISEVSKNYIVDIICIKNESSIKLNHVRNIWYSKGYLAEKLLRRSVTARASRLSLNLLSEDFGARIGYFFIKKILEEIKSEVKLYDYVFSLISSHHISPLLLAEKIKKEYPKIKNIAYFVDAIPAPLGWSSDNKEFRSLKKFISNRIKFLDGIFSSNESMLNYQISLARHKKPDFKSVILTPTLPQKLQFPLKKIDRYNFLFTGGIYGKRTGKHVFNALKILLKSHPNAYLVFVGTKFSDEDFTMLTENERKHIEVHPFTTDLKNFYTDSIALLDIDAELDNDVYLSSKITNYIMINRIIISETSSNSPAKKIFGNIESILQCAHNPQEIADKMRLAIKLAPIIDYKDRDEVINKFLVENIVNELDVVLKKSSDNI